MGSETNSCQSCNIATGSRFGSKRSRTRRSRRSGSKSKRKMNKKMFGATLPSEMSNKGGSNDMSIFQSYTGMSPSQMMNQMQNIPTNLQSNFFRNIGTSYGSRKSRSMRSMRSMRSGYRGKVCPGCRKKKCECMYSFKSFGSKKICDGCRKKKCTCFYFSKIPTVARRFGSDFGPARSSFGPASSSFGKNLTGLSSIMSNSAPSDMSLFQSYAGLAPGQMSAHMAGVPVNLQTNFYRNLGSSYGSKKRTRRTRR
jgi:hypothetical protein